MDNIHKQSLSPQVISNEVLPDHPAIAYWTPLQRLQPPYKSLNKNKIRDIGPC